MLQVRLWCAIGIAWCCLLMTGCASQEESSSQDGKINIVATTGMIGDLAKNIGGDHVDVTILMGPGVDPHLYKASERDVTRMAGADIIFYNGLHLEGAMGEVIEQMNKRKTTVAVAGEIDASKLLTSEDYVDAHDPHVWFDVSLWMNAAEVVHRTLVDYAEEHAEAFDSNMAVYSQELENLHQYVIDQAAKIPEDQRVLITAHDAFNYFGRAYGFEVRGLQGISTSSEAGTGDVQDLAGFIVERKIPAMFIESSVPVKNIEAVQAAVRDQGFEVIIGGELFSDAMGSTGTPEGTYTGMVRHNINTIVSALIAEGTQ